MRFIPAQTMGRVILYSGSAVEGAYSVFLKCLKRIFGVFDCIFALIPLDFYALPLLPEGQAAAAPRES